MAAAHKVGSSLRHIADGGVFSSFAIAITLEAQRIDFTVLG